MKLYEEYLLPRLIHFAMQGKRAAARRAALVPQAHGTVLEIGIGSGLNLPLYAGAVERLYGVDPSPQLLAMARKKAREARFPVEFLARSAEQLPFANCSIDTVVSTWTLCSIADPVGALREARRVLRPEGRLLFVEHGDAPDPGVRAWQARLNPVWRRLAGGCNLNRKIDALVHEAGFRFDRLETGYLRGPRPFTFTYEGAAQTM